MKKLILLLFLIQLQQLHAQNIPNADFSDIYIGAIDRLRDWGNSEGCQMGMPFGMMYYVGFDYSSPEYYITLRTKVDTSGNVTPSFLFSSSINFNYNAGCNKDFIYVGQSFPYRPSKMLGHYRFRNDSLHTNDFATCTVILKKFNAITQIADTIGYGLAQLTSTPADTLENFAVDIQYFNQNIVPDSVVVIFHSTGANLPGGVLSVDDLSFGFSSNTKNILNNEQFSVFPNPVQDMVQIKSLPITTAEKNQIEVFNIQGQRIYVEHFDNETQLLTNDWSNGIYIIKIENEKYQGVFRVVKQ